MNPVVSIVIPTCHSEATLAACLRSVAEQTYPHKEVIVIDNASTDATLSIVKGLAVL